ncbi:alanine racemase [Actinoalloteichus spitiensis]|uniref:alanine racemase n=1 Tax=Actinoalloteichus spitiensis TaxID=252394 RepID=UPI00037D76F5|nr:alanine racemase [Actinoalloteichus spitiensis]
MTDNTGTTRSPGTPARPEPGFIDDGAIGWRFKGLPPEAAHGTLAELGSSGRRVFDGEFGFPLLVLRDSALRHNAELMALFAAERGMSLAPHLKTSASPQVADYALRAGAWGVTVANPFQARVFMAAGHDRILLANQLVDRAFAVEAAHWLGEEPERRFFCYVDSPAGVAVLADALTSQDTTTPLPVLVEVGHEGGRGGCRDTAALAATVDAVRATPALALAGVSGYEGSVSHSRGGEGLRAVRDYLGWLRAAMDIVLAHRDPRLPEYVVSAGGSLYFDLVGEEIATGWPADPPVRVIARPGAYLTHDQGLYHALSPLDGSGSDPAEVARLAPAIEVWAPVLTRPTPDQVILGAGRRELNYDEGLPLPIEARDHRGGSPRPTPGWQVTALNDQHAFLTVPPDADLGPSDLVRLGISHPCTAHDRWLTAVIAADDDTVVSVARCYF